MISTSVASSSSRLSMMETRCDSWMSISVRRRRARREAMFSRGAGAARAGSGGRDLVLTGMGLFEVLAKAGDGATELAQFILVGSRLFLQLAGVLLAEPLHVVAQHLDGAVQLAGFVVPGGDGGLHGRLLVDLQRLQFVAQRGRGGAKLARLVLRDGHGGLHGPVARGLHTLQFGAERGDGAMQMPELALGQPQLGIVRQRGALLRMQQRFSHRGASFGTHPPAASRESRPERPRPRAGRPRAPRPWSARPWRVSRAQPLRGPSSR